MRCFTSDRMAASRMNASLSLNGRLIDYGFHAPTMSLPVAGTLMIEPNLFGQVENHVFRVGILRENVVDPELEAKVLGSPMSVADTIQGPSGQDP
jgi:hypothetical protein